MPDDRNLRTMFAAAAVDFADMFRSELGQLRLGAVGWVPELTAPEGVSTAGGRQATQHLRLVPSVKGYSPIIVGSASAATRTAEIRVYEWLDLAHQERFGKPVPLDRASYNQLLTALRTFFARYGVQVTLATPPPPGPVAGARARAQVSPAMKAIGGVLVALLVALVVVVLLLGRK